jgi:hypothetical protein
MENLLTAEIETDDAESCFAMLQRDYLVVCTTSRRS